MTQLATLFFIVGIYLLFRLARERRIVTSKALWIPVIWLFIAGSRPVSAWLGTGGPGTDAYYEGSPFDAAVSELLIGAALIVLLRRKPRLAAILKRNWPIVVFFAYCLLSVCWSDYPFVAFKRWIKATGDLMMVLIVLTDSGPAAAAKRVFIRTGFLLIPLSLLLIYFYPGLGRDFGGWITGFGYIGVATSKNELGMISMVWGLALLWCFIDAYRLKREHPQDCRPALAACGTVLVLALFLVNLSNSATSLVCFLLGSGLMIMTSQRAVAMRPAVVRMLLFTVVASQVIIVFVAPSLVTLVGRQPTLTGRTDLWPVVISLVRNPLIGTGFESFWLGSRLDYMRRLYPWRPNEAHNGYIETYLNSGWIGVLLLAIMLIAGLRSAVSAVRQGDKTGNLRLTYVAVALVYNLTEGALRETNPVRIALLLAITALPAIPAWNRAPMPPAAGEVGESDTEEEWFNPLAVQAKPELIPRRSFDVGPRDCGTCHV